MKKITLTLIIFLIGLTSIIMLSKEKVSEIKKESKSSFISMMMENEEGKYIEKVDINFPKEEYMFNPEKSGCENGGILTWNKAKEKIETSLLTSDKCYAYFDKYDFTKSCMFGYEDNLACELIKKKENTLIYHNGTIKSGDIIIDAQDYSYRYSGATDIVNNYVCLGENNNATGECAANDLYHIIGLFKNDKGHYEMKLIKTLPYEGEDAKESSNTTNSKGYYWSGSSTNQKNTWKDSILNTMLNEKFLNSLPSYVQSKIVFHTYITAGDITSDRYVYETYQYEIKNFEVGEFATKEDKTYEGKIGLMYISDYGYAAYKEAWTTQTLFNYGANDVFNNNWLRINATEWLITRTSNSSNVAFGIYGGPVSMSYVYERIFVVRPVFYLDTKTMKKSGEGTLASPYRLF